MVDEGGTSMPEYSSETDNTFFVQSEYTQEVDSSCPQQTQFGLPFRQQTAWAQPSEGYKYELQQRLQHQHLAFETFQHAQPQAYPFRVPSPEQDHRLNTAIPITPRSVELHQQTAGHSPQSHWGHQSGLDPQHHIPP